MACVYQALNSNGISQRIALVCLQMRTRCVSGTMQVEKRVSSLPTENHGPADLIPNVCQIAYVGHHADSYPL